MKEAILTRYDHGKFATLGKLYVPDASTVVASAIEFYTLENPWLDNAKNISCIPEGEYICKMRNSPRFGWRYHLQGTEPRTWILIHPGNYPKDTKGCIMLGLAAGETSDGEPAVWSSLAAVTDFEELMDKEDFKLIIRKEVLET